MYFSQLRGLDTVIGAVTTKVVSTFVSFLFKLYYCFHSWHKKAFSGDQGKTDSSAERT